MGVTAYLLLCCAAIWKPKSKKVCLALSIFMLLLFGLNENSVDYANYEYVYKVHPNGITFAYEPLYELLLTVCRFGGLNFTGFRVIMGLICVICSYKAASSLTNYPALVMAIYILYPFLHYSVAIRAGVAGAIVMYAISLLLKSKSKPINKFIVAILIATLFHYTSVFYLVCLVVKLPISNKKLLIINILCAGIMIILVHFTNIFYVGLSKLLPSEKVLAWFDPASKTSGLLMNFNGVIYITLVVIANCILCFCAKRVTHKLVLPPSNAIQIDVIDAAFRISLMLIPILPLLVSDVVYLRFLKAIFMLTICSCAETLALPRVRKDTKAAVYFVCLLGYIFILVFMKNKPLVKYTPYSYFVPFFENILFY